MNGRAFGAGLVVSLSLASLGYLGWLAGDELAATTRLVVRAGGVILIGGLVTGLLYLMIKGGIDLLLAGVIALEQVKQERQKTIEGAIRQRHAEAEVRKLEREAELTIVTAPLDHQVHISDMNPYSYWQARHLEARIYANGPQSAHPPQPWELGLWLAARQRRLPAEGQPLPPPEWTAGETALPERVELADLIPAMRGSLKNIVLGIRRDPTGQIRTVSAPMYRLCHIGVAGATDSGKSNFGRAIAYQVFTAVESVKVVLSDLKGTTFKAFNHSGRLLYPIIHSPSEFIAVMDELSGEMQRRKALFKPYPTVETLMDYNKTDNEPLPYIVIFVDEISNLFMTKETQEITLEMLREARAFGMYFVAMGQSWSYREMSPSIRQQFRTGMHFGTNDPASSRMIVNSSDAVKIMVPGRALASLPFGMGQGAVEIQTPYIGAGAALQAIEQFEFAGELDRGGPEKSIPELETLCPEDSPPASPTAKQAKVLHLWDNGVLDKETISRQVYGRVGGRQYELIEAALAKFGRTQGGQG